MSKRIKKEIKEEILEKIESGEKVVELASVYGISPKTVYSWLAKASNPENISLLKYNKLKRENEELKRIIGKLTLDLSKRKKNKTHQIK